MLLLASAFAAPPAPSLAPGERLAIAATLDQCTVSAVATARGRREVELSRGMETVARGRGTVEWSGLPPAGDGDSGARFNLTATTRRDYKSVQVDVVAPELGPLLVDGAPLVGKVTGFADAPPVVTMSVSHPCPELLTFHVSNFQFQTDLQAVDGVLSFPLPETFGEVVIQAYWNGYRVGERRSFEMRVQGARSCYDDDGDGLSDCEGDCDDDDDRVRPGFPEVPWDGHDNDCDGKHAGDADGDGRDAGGRVPRIDVAGMRMLEDLYGPIRARRVARQLVDPTTERNMEGAEGSLFDCDDTNAAIGSSDAFEAPARCVIARPGPGDDDGDGFAHECADSDATRHPGAVEVQNGFDDNCDGRIDEGMAVPDLDDTTVAAPRQLGLLDMPHTERFVLSDRDVDAFVFAVRPPREATDHVIEIDAGGGSWHGTLFGVSAAELSADRPAGGLQFVTQDYGSAALNGVWMRVNKGDVITFGSGGALGITLGMLHALPTGAAMAVGTFLVPAAAVADAHAPLSRTSPAPAPAPVPGDTTIVPSALPTDAYVYLLVITRDKGPGGPAEVRIREAGWY